MRHDDIIELYDEEYASLYNERFLLGDTYRPTTEYEVSILHGLLEPGASWLDVACGTGYILSRFPMFDRAGLDLSPAMLSVASQDNPGITFILGDFLAKRPEWRERWDLVSCMWQAYSYVDTIDEILRLIRNLATWTAVGGTCFIPVCDLESLCATDVPFRSWLDTLDGTLQIDAVVWSCLEPSGKTHISLIAPHREVFVRELQRYFESVEAVSYPHKNGDAVQSRPGAVMAYGRKPEASWLGPQLHSKRKPAGLEISMQIGPG